jgi:hypothetical protein
MTRRKVRRRARPARWPRPYRFETNRGGSRCRRDNSGASDPMTVLALIAGNLVIAAVFSVAAALAD